MPRPSTSGWHRIGPPDRLVTMWSRVVPGQGGRDLAAAAAALGADHRLVRTLDAQVAVDRQLVVSSAALAAGTLGLGAGISWASAVLEAAAGVELVIVSAVVILATLARALARELIIEGQGELPLLLLARERRRLGNPRRQATLARALESLVHAAQTWPRIQRTARPVFDVRLVRAAIPELEMLTYLLHERPASVRAVALVERLLTSGNSPLYGQDPDELRRELACIRQELVRGSANRSRSPVRSGLDVSPSRKKMNPLSRFR